MELDIAEFYSFIFKEILDNAILFAQKFIDVPEKDLHCK